MSFAELIEYFGKELTNQDTSTIHLLLRMSSPNVFIGDPWFQIVKDWIPDQNRFGNDKVCD